MHSTGNYDPEFLAAWWLSRDARAQDATDVERLRLLADRASELRRRRLRPDWTNGA